MAMNTRFASLILKEEEFIDKYGEIDNELIESFDDITVQSSQFKSSDSVVGRVNESEYYPGRGIVIRGQIFDDSSTCKDFYLIPSLFVLDEGYEARFVYLAPESETGEAVGYTEEYTLSFINP